MVMLQRSETENRSSGIVIIERPRRGQLWAGAPPVGSGGQTPKKRPIPLGAGSKSIVLGLIPWHKCVVSRGMVLCDVKRKQLTP